MAITDKNEKWNGDTASTLTPQAKNDGSTTTPFMTISEDNQSGGLGPVTIYTADLMANDLGGSAKNFYAVVYDSIKDAKVSTSDGVTITYDANGKYDYLRAGEPGYDSFNYTIQLANGVKSTATVTVKIIGANDAAVIGSPTDSGVTEDESNSTLTATGTISITDKDSGEATFKTSVVSAAGNLGTLSIGTNGAYTYTVDNTKVQYLTAGQEKIDTYTVEALDGTAKQVSFTIKGVDELSTSPYHVGSGPHGVVASDLDADGILDLAFAENSSDTIGVMLGNGDGTFQSRTAYSTGHRPLAVAAQDLDGDHDVDLIVTNYSSPGTLSFLRGNGDGTFQPQSFLQTGGSGYPDQVVIADMNHDSHPDILASNNDGYGGISVLLSDGAGGFLPHQDFGAGLSPTGLSVGDLNGDGILDAVVSNYFSNDVTVLIGRSDGSFNQAGNLSAAGPELNRLVDLNGDAELDLVFANYNSSSLSVRMGVGDGTFGPEASYAVGANPIGLEVGDITGDGLLDVVTSNVGSGEISLLAGDGHGAFGPAETIGRGPVSGYLSLGHFDGNGSIDVAFTNQGDNTLSVLRNGLDFLI
jgi:VCBS repeat-containing protein